VDGLKEMLDCHQADNPGTLLARPGTAGSSHVETRTLALPKTGLAGSEVTGRLAASSDGAPVGAGQDAAAVCDDKLAVREVTAQRRQRRNRQRPAASAGGACCRSVSQVTRWVA
jgi:hypothetical protein